MPRQGRTPPPQDRAMSSTRGRILVVDDEPIVRLSCSRTLCPKGYEVDMANDGFEALGRLKEQSYDIIITDLKMPDMDGIEFIGMLKRTSPGARVLMVTGFATDEVREQAEAMGARYLPKPFNPAELLGAVDELGGA